MIYIDQIFFAREHVLQRQNFRIGPIYHWYVIGKGKKKKKKKKIIYSVVSGSKKKDTVNKIVQ
jgi:hypothetical protein